MSESPKTTLKTAIDDILATIDQEREREIIARRFGLFDRKETLEQIGEMLGITRERVRQLEKAILIRLKSTAEKDSVPSLTDIERAIVRDLADNGRSGKVADVTNRLVGNEPYRFARDHVAFIAELSPRLILLNESDNYYQGVAIAESNTTEKSVRLAVDDIVRAIKKHGQPLDVEELHGKLPYESPKQVQSLAGLSKQLATLRGIWGLAKWPTVNPKNIRDKIFVTLTESRKPMHFSDIADAIKQSDFKRKDVTVQAIHNELIKDPRFVLIGRGIYALEEWGYTRGTVSQIIAKILKKAGEPMHRDEIVKQVLKKRQVKETTVLLNLQSKPEFKRVSKATYTLAKDN